MGRADYIIIANVVKWANSNVDADGLGPNNAFVRELIDLLVAEFRLDGRFDEARFRNACKFNGWANGQQT